MGRRAHALGPSSAAFRSEVAESLIETEQPGLRLALRDGMPEPQATEQFW